MSAKSVQYLAGNLWLFKHLEGRPQANCIFSSNQSRRDHPPTMRYWTTVQLCNLSKKNVCKSSVFAIPLWQWRAGCVWWGGGKPGVERPPGRRLLRASLWRPAQKCRCSFRKHQCHKLSGRVPSKWKHRFSSACCSISNIFHWLHFPPTDNLSVTWCKEAFSHGSSSTLYPGERASGWVIVSDCNRLA